jgi:hypothetical protein
MEHVEPGAFDCDPENKPVFVRFRDLILGGEASDEQSSGLATVLTFLGDPQRFPAKFSSAEVARFAAGADDDAISFRSALEQATGKAMKVVSTSAITWKLKTLIDAPVVVETAAAERVMSLKWWPDHEGGRFSVVSHG